MKKKPLETKEVEFKLPNGITLIISAWVRSKTKSRRFNSPITCYDETDWHVSVELKLESKDEFKCNPTLASFSDSNTKEDVRRVTNALNCSLETFNEFLAIIRRLKNEVISEANEWNMTFANN